MTNTHAAPHLDDSELLHLTDGDASAFELDRWSRHVLECGECSARLAVLQRRAAALSRRLAEVQLPDGFAYPRPPAAAGRRAARGARGSGARSYRARAALAVLMVALPLVLVPPLRAWVAHRLADGWTRAAALLEGEETPESPTAPPPAAGSTIWFPLAGPELTVEVASAQDAGELILLPAEGAEGSLQVLGGSGETPVLVEGGVRILNAPRSTASYRLALPGSLRRVRVRVGGERIRDLSADEIRGGVRVELGS